MMKRQYEAYIERGLYRGTSIHIVEKRAGVVTAIAKPMVMVAINPDEPDTLHDPAIVLPHHDTTLLQSIVDQAWDLGIRPRYAQESGPQLGAMKNHLEDMRRLVFKDEGQAAT
jgi:hypothetical protein